MIFNQFPKKSIFYTLILNTIVALLLIGCSGGGGGSTNTPTVETPAVASISGKVTDINGNALNNVTVELRQGNTVIDTQTTDANGNYTITPPDNDTFQLKFSRPDDINNGDKFATQFKSVTVEPGSGVTVPSTILSKVDRSIPITNATGGTINAPDSSITNRDINIEIPPAATNENITANLTILNGVEIPSILPTEPNKTLLPVGAISLDLLTSDGQSVTTLNNPITASIPVPVALQNNNDNNQDRFSVYRLVEGEWKKQDQNAVLNQAKDTVTFDINIAGTYMVMTDIPDINTNPTTNIQSTVSTVTTATENVTSGSTITKPLINETTINIDAVTDTTISDEIRALIKNLLEQQNQAQINEGQATTTETTIFVPNIATSKQSATELELAAKLVCTATTTVTTRIYFFIFDIPGLGTIVIQVTEIITRTTVSCEDVPDPTGATGGTG